MLPELFKVVKKALLILLLFVAFDLLFGLIYKPFYINQGPSRFNKMIYANGGGNKEEIIILGDSRAEHHYHSEQLALETGKTVYNYGSDGQSVFFNFALLSKLLETYTPEKVIYEISQTEIEYSADAYDRLSYFLPMQNNHADEILSRHLNPFKLFVSKLFNAYKYNSTAFIILKSYLAPKEYIAGYQPLHNKLDARSFKDNPSEYVDLRIDYTLDSIKIDCFERILQLAEEYNFELYYFISPTLFQSENEQLFSIVNNSLNKYGYSVHNYLNDQSYPISSFADPIHLNDQGAAYYTKQIISTLQ